jgi:EAL domain-containing protein (putative c-di-GMP-specific phosphodiesterase class I)
MGAVYRATHLGTKRTVAVKVIHPLGVQLSIDDFGTGYSSLSYLHRFPLNYLKIDRSFVMRLTTDNDNAIVRTISTLARNLGMEVIAEGIETEEQYQQLKMLGCEYGQGYLFSRPVDNAGLRRLLAQDANRELEPDLDLAQPTGDNVSLVYSM